MTSGNIEGMRMEGKHYYLYKYFKQRITDNIHSKQRT